MLRRHLRYTAYQMSHINFSELLDRAITAQNSLVCVGLDPEPEHFPSAIKNHPRAIFKFNREIIDATADLVCAYKPQIAHYAALGAEDQLMETITYIRQHAPTIPIILDSKRGDIGNTAKKYAYEAFERYGADAVTINPYLGFDAAEPFLKYAHKGIVVLCRTSNAGAHEFQNLVVEGKKLYQIVAEHVAERWNKNGNCLLVVGATHPTELADIRARTGEMTFLVPGVGAQGGDVALAVKNGQTKNGRGIVINSSRGIIYSSSGADFADAARSATLELRTTINLNRY